MGTVSTESVVSCGKYIRAAIHTNAAHKTVAMLRCAAFRSMLNPLQITTAPRTTCAAKVAATAPEANRSCDVAVGRAQTRQAAVRIRTPAAATMYL